MMVIGVGAGLTFVGRGVWTALRGGPFVTKSGGRGWSTAGHAAAFWLLLGGGLLLVGVLPIGKRMGVIGIDTAFWIGFVPLGLLCLAAVAFPPRRAAQRSKP